MKNVFIIGNGFDLDLGLTTRYSDFANSKYWPAINQIRDRRSIFSIAEDKPYHALGLSLRRLMTENWFDLEEALLDYAANEVASLDRDLYSPQDDIEYYNELQSKLCDYLIHVQNSTPINIKALAGNVLRAVIENGYFDNIFSFNYTDLNILAKQLGVSQTIKYTHMHGKLSDRSIILGVDESPLTNGYEDFHKSQSIHYRYNSLLNALEEADEIVIYGLSFGSIDWGYFSDFFSNLVEKNISEDIKKYITIFTKDACSVKKIKNQFRNKSIDVQKLFSKVHIQFIQSDVNANDQTIEFYERLKLYSKGSTNKYYDSLISRLTF